MPWSAFRGSCVSVPDSRKLNNSKVDLQHPEYTLQGNNVNQHYCGHPRDCRLQGKCEPTADTHLTTHYKITMWTHTTVDSYMTTQNKTTMWTHTAVDTLLTIHFKATIRTYTAVDILMTTHYNTTVWTHTAVDTLLITHDKKTMWTCTAVDALQITHYKATLWIYSGVDSQCCLVGCSRHLQPLDQDAVYLTLFLMPLSCILVSSWTTLKCEIWGLAMAKNQVSSSVELFHWSGIPRHFDRP